MSNNTLPSRRIALKLGTTSALSFLLSGCKATPPVGSTVQPTPLGSIVDEANRRQEDNAEAAKFVVYNHEFELNKPLQLSEQAWIESGTDQNGGASRTVHSVHPRGFRLNEYGVEHVERLAKALLAGSSHKVVVERSESSRKSKTLHQYAVHFNDKLDQERRDVVVEALFALGVENAAEWVVIAPAFPTGLHSREAVQAYNQTRTSGSSGGGSGGSGNSGGRGTGGF